MNNAHVSVFETSVAKADQWVAEVAETMGIVDRQEAYRTLRAVLHALRDQLTVHENKDLSAQMPMVIRGLFFEGWNPAKAEHVRDAGQFEEAVMAHHGARPQRAPREMIAGVARVLSARISEGEFRQVLHSLAEPVRELFTPQSAFV